MVFRAGAPMAGALGAPLGSDSRCSGCGSCHSIAPDQAACPPIRKALQNQSYGQCRPNVAKVIGWQDRRSGDFPWLPLAPDQLATDGAAAILKLQPWLCCYNLADCRDRFCQHTH